MASITSYATLVQAVKDVAEDDGLEFADYIPTAIAMAEERLFRELDLPDLETKATGKISTSTLTKPSDYEYPHYFSITVSSSKKQLKKRGEDFIIDYWPNAALTGEPKYYCDSSSTQIIIAPTPDQSYSYTLKYSAKPTKLSTSNTSNYFITNCQDILFYAVMSEMARFMKAWSEIEAWEQSYNAVVGAWNISMLRKRRQDGELPMNPEGGPNTIKHTAKSNS